MNITRSLARQLRAVFRRAGIKSTPRDSGPWVFFQTGPQGLSTRARSHEVAIEYHQAGDLPVEQLRVPLSLLGECEGRESSHVSLEAAAGGSVVASWTARGIPQQRTIEATRETKADQPFPERPERFIQNSPELITALLAAGDSSDSDSTRYALGRIQLRGRSGKIGATDGKQLLLQGGYEFPWPEDLLVARPAVLGCPEIPRDQPVHVGRTEDWVCLAIGPWSIHLAIDKHGRFPKIDDCIPRTSAVVSRLQLDEQDAKFLTSSIEELPGGTDFNRPLTLDLNGQVLVRAKSNDQPRPTEVVLSGSRLIGEPLQVGMDRRYLSRALALGFRELQFVNPHSPVLCDDGQRQFVWATLSPERDSTVPGSEVPEPIRIESGVATPRAATETIAAVTPSIPQNRIQTMPQNSTNQPSSENQSEVNVTTKPAIRQASPIEEAIVLRDSLRDTLAKTNQLIHCLKQQKRQSKLVAETLASLKQLQAAG